MVVMVRRVGTTTIRRIRVCCHGGCWWLCAIVTTRGVRYSTKTKTQTKTKTKTATTVRSDGDCGLISSISRRCRRRRREKGNKGRGWRMACWLVKYCAWNIIDLEIISRIKNFGAPTTKIEPVVNL